MPFGTRKSPRASRRRAGDHPTISRAPRSISRPRRATMSTATSSSSTAAGWRDKRNHMEHLPDAQRARALSTDELRASFLVQGLFKPGEIVLRHIDLDRVVLGGVVPLARPPEREAPASLAASYFAERRELGVLNIGERGAIVVDGARHCMERRHVLY